MTSRGLFVVSGGRDQTLRLYNRTKEVRISFKCVCSNDYAGNNVSLRLKWIGTLDFFKRRFQRNLMKNGVLILICFRF